MSTTIRYPATLEAATRKKDRSVSLRFVTSFEVSNNDFAVTDTLHGASGWLLFCEEELTEQHVPDEPLPSEATPKRPSQRLRAALFVVWKETNDQRDFDTYYRHSMERIIEDVKREIPE